jgi:diaminopimelate epimerase
MTPMAPLDGVVIYKMTGSGNDFVFADGRTAPLELWTTENVRRVCSRQTGVGTDGLVILEPGSRSGAVRFQFFNSDGSRAPMCGNAALCATRLSAWLELAPPQGMVLETDAGDVRSRCVEPTNSLAEIALPEPGALIAPEINREQGEHSIHFTTVGVPHVVVMVDDLRRPGLMDRGRALRSHPALGAGGANVNFATRVGAEWAMRTYERGVEDETLACGTGAVASTAVLCRWGDARPPLRFRTASGAVLTVLGDLDGTVLRSPRLVGEGRIVFRAILGGNPECVVAD